MKTTVSIVIVLLTLSAIAYGEQGFVFSVSPGMSIQSSSFGYQLGRFIPSIGMDVAFMTVNGKYTTSDWGYDWRTSSYYKWSTDHSKISGSAVLFMPHVGLRYMLRDHAARPYLQISVALLRE
ncbi:hypothetical protein HY768_09455 [candidate division TA06 bacterium]|uniref:Uncharacterized protein n=1 Tax=candidate division TA06 bacterium TaxID=2250710 RepID=A0A933IBV0_UNCT6|nr:hypothetical protein [candidate division TA06 bacterium]